MYSLVCLCLSLAAASASVLPGYGSGWGGGYGAGYGGGYGSGYGSGWGDYGKLGGYGGGWGGYGHHAPATSYANVWKVDHDSHPVIVKPHHPAPVTPIIKTYPSLGYAAWDQGHVPSYPSHDPWAVTGLGSYGYGSHAGLGGYGAHY